MKIFITYLFILFLFLTTNTIAHYGSKGPFGGSVSCSVVNDTSVFIGTFTGGVFVSTNSQLLAWRPRPVGLKSGKINALAHTGSYLFCATDSGVYRFTGYMGNERYWENANLGILNYNVTSLVAIDSITLLAGSNGDGIFRSDNNGVSWSQSNLNLGDLVVQKIIRAGSRIIVGTSNGLWASDDNGQSWINFNNNLTMNVSIDELSYNGSTDQLLAGNLNMLFVLSTAATTTSPLYQISTANLPGGSVINDISNNNSNWYLATNSGVFFSSTLAFNWINVSTGLTNLNINTIINSPPQNVLIAGTNGDGIYKTSSTPFLWTTLNTGFNNLETYSIFTKDAVVVVAATECGISVSGDLATSYSLRNNGLTDSLNVNDITFLNSSLIAVTENSGVFVSSDTGWNYSSYNVNLTNLTIRKAYATLTYAYIIDSNGEIFQSDLTSGWNSIQSGLPLNVNPVALTLSNGNLILGTYGNGIFIRPESGGSWFQQNLGLPNLNVTSVTANYHNKIFAGTNGNGVYVSDATNISWTPTATLTIPFTVLLGLTTNEVQDLDFYAGYVFASVRGAIFATSDNGATWIEGGTQFNLPSYADLNKLAFVTTRIFTSTPNNSLYSNGLSELPTIIGIDEIESDSPFAIAPNPANGIFAINFDPFEYKIDGISVYDLTGKLIFESDNAHTYEYVITAPDGMYILEIKSKAGIFNERLIIQSQH